MLPGFPRGVPVMSQGREERQVRTGEQGLPW
jgi:hypothetical protein